jgi:hypothetical protein
MNAIRKEARHVEHMEAGAKSQVQKEQERAHTY